MNIEFEFDMEYVPYTLLASGHTLEALLDDAAYNYACSDNGTNFLHIGNLPQKDFDAITQRITEEFQSAHADRVKDRAKYGY